MWKFAPLTLFVLPLVAGQTCVEELTGSGGVVPHFANALEFMEVPTGDFTFFAPSEEAAIRLSSVLASEGCSTVPAETIREIVSAAFAPGVITSANLNDKATGIDIPLPSGDMHLSVTQNAGGDIIIAGSAAASKDEIVDIVTAMPAGQDMAVCGGRGIVHLVDDVIVPPNLLMIVQEAAAGEQTGCPADTNARDAGIEPEDEEQVDTNDALLAEVDIDLETENASLGVPISASVNTEAVGPNGETIPINQDLLLETTAAIEEVASWGSTAVTVEVPVTVTVNVQAGDDCDIAEVNVPVDIDIAVDLLVDGNPVGSGSAQLAYGPCVGNRNKPRWQQCAGTRIVEDAEGSPLAEVFRSQCRGTNKCVEKNGEFAMCMPERARVRFMQLLGWKGSILECE